jgi:hypothetical protein
LFYINPQFYGYSAITKVMLQNVRMKCEFESTLNCISKDGNAVLAMFGFDSVNPYGHLVVSIYRLLLYSFTQYGACAGVFSIFSRSSKALHQH